MDGGPGGIWVMDLEGFVRLRSVLLISRMPRNAPAGRHDDVLDGGEVVQQGSHEAPVATGGPHVARSSSQASSFGFVQGTPHPEVTP
jgi:hypothetical protein